MKTVNLSNKEMDAIICMTMFWLDQNKTFETMDNGKFKQQDMDVLVAKLCGTDLV